MVDQTSHRCLSSQASGAFRESLVQLDRHVEQIPMGWQRLYGDLRHALRVVYVPARMDIQIDGAWEEDGMLRVESQTADPVVQGALRKARMRAMTTCMDCGKPGKPRQLQNWHEATLCGTCAGLQLLMVEINRLIALDRCGTVDLRQELQSSSDAVLVRTAAEAAAQAFGLPATFIVSELDSDGLRAWLHSLLERAQQEPPT